MAFVFLIEWGFKAGFNFTSVLCGCASSVSSHFIGDGPLGQWKKWVKTQQTG